MEQLRELVRQRQHYPGEQYAWNFQYKFKNVHETFTALTFMRFRIIHIKIEA